MRLTVQPATPVPADASHIAVHGLQTLNRSIMHDVSCSMESGVVFTKTSWIDASAELKLVAACAMWPASDRRTGAIAAAAVAELDWDRVLRLAIRHRVVGLLYDGLRYLPKAPPADASAAIRIRAHESAHQNLILKAEALQIERLFTAANLPVGFLKGTSVALLAYGNCAIRHGRDIDLLVDSEFAPAAFSILEQAGYRRRNLRFASDKQLATWLREVHHFSFVHGKTGTEIELHWRLFRNRNLDLALKRGKVGLNASPRDATDAKLKDVLVYLCVHGSMHQWFRLKWLADVAAILAQMPQGERESFYDLAVARGAGAPAGQAILLCHRVLGLSLSAVFLAALQADPLLSRLERVALDKIVSPAYAGEPHTWPFPAGLVSIAEGFMLPGWKYRAEELRMFFISLEDIEQFPLPRSLAFLYPLLRLPLWLQRKFHRPSQDLR